MILAQDAFLMCVIERAHLKGSIPQIDEVSVLHPANPLHAPHAVLAGVPRRAGLWNDFEGLHPRRRPHPVACANDIRLGRVDEEVGRVQVVELKKAPGVICSLFGQGY